jgi:hypothetical protein
LFRQALRNLNVDDDWTFASKHFGVTTYYRREDDGSLSVKLEGVLQDVPLFEQVCVLKEIDLHFKWSPFCSSSMTLADFSKMDTMGWFVVGVPQFGLSRDGIFRAIGCDNTAEDGSVLITAQGIRDKFKETSKSVDTTLSDDPLIDLLDLPPVPTRMGSGRLTVKRLDAVINVLSPTSARTRVVANVDPNMDFLPQSLLEFCMKHMAGAILSKLQAAAKKVQTNPLRNPHAIKMREERDFYQGWLMPKFEAMCRQRGWTMPKVPAFDLSPEDAIKAEHMKDRKVVDRSVSFNPIESSGHGTRTDVTARSTPAYDSFGDDSVSTVSYGSGNTRKTRNPIKKFLLEKERKAEAKKLEAIVEQRKVAADRLKPRAIPKDKERRLEELRSSREQRLESTDGVSSSPLKHPKSSLSINSTGASSKDMISRFHNHGQVMRTFIMLILISSMFMLLVFPFSHYSKFVQSRFLPMLTEDTVTVILTFLYMTTCAAIHFALCEVALLYAFSALELGAKAGLQIKRFYGRNVQYGVVLLSLGILVTGIVKVLSKVSFRALIKISLHMYVNFVRSVLPLLEGLWTSTMRIVPNFVVQTTRWTGLAVSTTVWGVYKTVYFVLSLFHHLFLQSNIFGRLALRLGNRIASFAAYRLDRLGLFVLHTIDPEAGKMDDIPWYTDATNFVRMAYAYTGVFLVLVLLLFTLYARGRRARHDLSRLRAKLDSVHHKVMTGTPGVYDGETKSTTLSASESVPVNGINKDVQASPIRPSKLLFNESSPAKKSTKSQEGKTIVMKRMQSSPATNGATSKTSYEKTYSC